MNSELGLLLALFIELLALAIGILAVYMIYQGHKTVPFVKTKGKMADAICKLGDIHPDDTILDLGCGDGSFLIHAAKYHGTKGVGIERLKLLCMLGSIKCRIQKVSDQVKIHQGNIFSQKFPKADVIFVYLFNEVNKKLEPTFKKTFPPGTRIVSRQFTFPTLKLIDKVQFGSEKLYLYKI